MTYNYIAVDIAKESLAVHAEAFRGSFPYNAKGLNELLAKVRSVEHPIVVCEASGNYEKKLIEHMHDHQIPTALVNPSRVRAFARSDGLKAKTDPIDAALLMRFAQSKSIQPSTVHTQQQQDLQALMDRRDQLTSARAQEKNRLDKSSQTIIPSIKKIIQVLDDEIKDIEEQIEQIVAQDKTMSAQHSIMQSIKGVGKATSWSILAYLTEITSLKRNQIVALAGIAPFPKDSGAFSGKRRIEGGRAKVRKCLFMAAQTAATYNPHIKTYVDGLKARSKPHKCAIVAAMRKLLIHIQSMLKNHELSLA